ncbi:hypothetical protein FI667_g4992, partial [Globisporangium splendens]
MYRLEKQRSLIRAIPCIHVYLVLQQKSHQHGVTPLGFKMQTYHLDTPLFDCATQSWIPLVVVWLPYRSALVKKKFRHLEVTSFGCKIQWRRNMGEQISALSSFVEHCVVLQKEIGRFDNAALGCSAE